MCEYKECDNGIKRKGAGRWGGCENNADYKVTIHYSALGQLQEHCLCYCADCMDESVRDWRAFLDKRSAGTIVTEHLPSGLKTYYEARR